MRSASASSAYTSGEGPPVRVFDTLEKLAAGDMEGPQQQLTTGELVRSWPVPPFRIYYQRGEGELRVFRIYHHARRPIAR